MNSKHLTHITLVSLTLCWSPSALSQVRSPIPAPSPYLGVGGGGGGPAYFAVHLGKRVQGGNWTGALPYGAGCPLKQVGYLTALPPPNHGTVSYGFTTPAYPDAGPCFGYPEKLIFHTYTWTSSSATTPLDKWTLHYQSVDPQFLSGDQAYVYELIPTTESTVFTEWDDAQALPNIGNYRQTINPTGVNYDGVQVTEYSPKIGKDTCYFSTSSHQAFTSVSGSSWIVSSLGNQWGLDQIGFFPDVVQYYRDHAVDTPAHKLPCSFTVYQQMKINFLDGDVSQYNYGKVNTLTYTIDVSTVTVSRAGVSMTRTFP